MQIIPFCDYGESCFSNNRIAYGPQIVVKYVSTGLVNQKLNVMPQIEEKHEECERQFLEVLWNANWWISVGFQGLEQQGLSIIILQVCITNSAITA